jgi:hypothetical protein
MARRVENVEKLKKIFYIRLLPIVMKLSYFGINLPISLR